MNSKKLEKALKSVGKKSFVEDYEIFSNHNNSKSQKIEMLSKKYSQNGATIRISFAEEIIKNGSQKEAFKLIIDSPRISSEVKEKAKLLLVQMD